MYSCSECGNKSIKWLGKCPFCGGWETFAEEKEQTQKYAREKVPPKLIKDITQNDLKRVKTGFEEFDRIIGGGLVNGEIILVGGAPGVGKSTLLLEISSQLASSGKTLYVSAEESPEQIGLRAKRLNRPNLNNVYIVGEDNLEDIYEYIKKEEFKFVIIDSVQAVYSSSCEGSKGSVSQIRGCADFLTHIAKSLGIVVFVVGHVTKEGVIAGPKLLEHIVDCVLYFEGENISSYRILRAVKNRFGPTGDIAVFEMNSSGLEEVKKINDIFLPHKNESFQGSCVVCIIEGLRPLLLELQSLVSRANFGMARQRSLGFDFNRFFLLIAIIEKRLKLPLGRQDVFFNVAGGLRISDPAADLGAVMAIISSLKEKDLPVNTVFIGEVGLSGELRRVNNINLRLKEIERVNFKHCIIPEVSLKEVDKKFTSMVKGFSYLKDVVSKVFN